MTPRQSSGRSTAESLASCAATAREATARRDQLIRQMRDEGATYREIAAAAGMTHQGIMRILRRDAAAG